MKTLKITLISLVTVFTFNSCNSEDSSKGLVKSEKNSEHKVESKKLKIKSDFSNPAIIYGSDFLSFFKSLRKIGNIDEMISFTSSESVKKIGKNKLKELYKDSFNNMSKSKLLSLEELDNNYNIMHYSNSEFATKKAFSIKVVVENDSTKLVYEDKFPF